MAETGKAPGGHDPPIEGSNPSRSPPEYWLARLGGVTTYLYLCPPQTRSWVEARYQGHDI